MFNVHASDITHTQLNAYIYIHNCTFALHVFDGARAKSMADMENEYRHQSIK